MKNIKEIIENLERLNKNEIAPITTITNTVGYDPNHYLNKFCPKCGGKHLHEPLLTTGEFYCICPADSERTGWICPRCKTVNHPDSMKCDCKPE